MKVENTTYSSTRTYTFYPDQGYSFNLELSEDKSNCKLSYIHQAGALVNRSDKIKKEAIDFLLQKAKGCIIINTTNKQVADWLSKNYDTYYYNEVPIGYNESYQYHICIRNNVAINHNCRKPEALKVQVFDKDSLKVKMKAILKKLRRKSDYVDELVDSI